MENPNNHNLKKDVLRLATFVGQLMLSNGAETFRVDVKVMEIALKIVELRRILQKV